MLNPDGVFYGNTRTNICGRDLNRSWHANNQIYHYETYLAKHLVHRLGDKSIKLVLDLHGHYVSTDSFFYGNSGFNSLPMLYPFICSRVDRRISFSKSRFSSANPKGVSRIYLG
jgi:hypothetical protein